MIKVDSILGIRDAALTWALEPHSDAQVQSVAEGSAPGASSPVVDRATGTRLSTPPRKEKKRRAPNKQGIHEFHVE